MNVIEKLIDFWKLLQVEYVYDNSISIPAGAATFSNLTINAVKNKKNVIFIYPCYRPSDAIKNSNIRSDKFFQIQVIICNFNLLCKSLNMSPILIAYKSILHITGFDYLFNLFEDNWSSPTMKSFGIGWEFRVFGLEVLQITKFNTFAGINISNDNIYEYTYGYDRLCNLVNSNECKNLANNFKELNLMFSDFSNKSTIFLKDTFVNLLNKSKCDYQDFLKLNLIFNILDTRNVYSIYTKNLYMKSISNKIKDWNNG